MAGMRRLHPEQQAVVALNLAISTEYCVTQLQLAAQALIERPLDQLRQQAPGCLVADRAEQQQRRLASGIGNLQPLARREGWRLRGGRPAGNVAEQVIESVLRGVGKPCGQAAPACLAKVPGGAGGWRAEQTFRELAHQRADRDQWCLRRCRYVSVLFEQGQRLFEHREQRRGSTAAAQLPGAGATAPVQFDRSACGALGQWPQGIVHAVPARQIGVATQLPAQVQRSVLAGSGQ